MLRIELSQDQKGELRSIVRPRITQAVNAPREALAGVKNSHGHKKIEIVEREHLFEKFIEPIGEKVGTDWTVVSIDNFRLDEPDEKGNLFVYR